MIDIHSHILPGLDDGARDFAEALKLARLAAADGVHQVIATPHSYGECGFYECFPREICSTVKAFQQQLDAEQIPLRVYQGMEVYLNEESLDYLGRGWLLPLANSDCLLCEFAGEDIPTMTERLEKVAKLGYRPLVAHAERYRALWKSGSPILEWKRKGWYLQINASSLTREPHGFRERYSVIGRENHAAWAMLQEDAVFAVASDCHDLHHRPPCISAAKKLVETRLGEACANKLLLENPASLLS